MRAADLLVIGGGVHGLALALEGAERGLRTLLVERGALGEGASAATFGVLHSGIRHLQRLDLARARRSARGQAWYRRRFPELVEPLACLAPLPGGLRRPGGFLAAMALQRAIAGAESGAGRVLSRREVEDVCPALAEQAHLGAGCWHDLVVPDVAALIDAMARAARQAGATLATGREAVALETSGGAVSGVRVREAGRADAQLIEAATVANCAGGGAARLASSLDPLAPALFHPVLGFNLLLDRPAPFAGAVAFSGAGRAFFLRPHRGRLLAGTGYAPAQEDREPTAAEIEGFLRQLGEAAPHLGLREAAVLRVYSGALPGMRAGAATLRESDIVHDHARNGGPRGLISLAGVKFTTAPEAAADALALISRRVRESAPLGRAGSANAGAV